MDYVSPLPPKMHFTVEWIDFIWGQANDILPPPQPKYLEYNGLILF